MIFHPWSHTATTSALVQLMSTIFTSTPEHEKLKCISQAPHMCERTNFSTLGHVWIENWRGDEKKGE